MYTQRNFLLFAAAALATTAAMPAIGQPQLAGTLVRLLTRGSDAPADVPYRLSGKISLSQGWLQSIPFEQHGTFSLQ